MDSKTYFDSYLTALKKSMDETSRTKFEEIAETLLDAREKGKLVFTMGNGGSAATASHFVNDLMSLGIRSVALTDNVPTIMAIANDFSFEEVFKQQLETLKGYYGDTVIAFSCSGESENVIRAIQYANEHNKTTTVGFCGVPGSRLEKEAFPIPVPHHG